MNYEIIFFENAKEDLIAIVRYITDELLETNIANNFDITSSNNKTSSGSNSMGNTYNNKPQFWKISNGVFNNNKFKKYKKEKIVSIRRATLAKANSKTTQG